MSEAMTETKELTEADIVINLLRTTKLRIVRLAQEGTVEPEVMSEVYREAKALAGTIQVYVKRTV